MSAAAGSVGRGIAIRFSLVVGIVYVFPFPLFYLPKTAWLADQAAKPLEWATVWIGREILGLGDLPTAFNGSGDRALDYVGQLTIAMLCVLGTIVWSAIDRRRTSYPRLADAVRFALRYTVAYAMLAYGFSKIVRSQFSDLRPGQLVEQYGDMSPMRVLWSFMGYSTAYTVFAGLAEAIAGALLLWRRTATIGALIAAGVMTNVVMLNLCYDVPVKLYSTQLLVMAIVIALPRMKRIVAAAMGRATPEDPPGTRMSPRWERALWLLKLALVIGIAWNVYRSYGGRPSASAHVHELYGTWDVDSFVLDGGERPPLLTDTDRWRAISANPQYLLIWPMTGEREALSLMVDAAAHTITVKLDDDTKDKDRLKEQEAKQKADEADKDKEEDKDKETWKYQRPAPDQLLIDGTHRGKVFHVALHLRPPPLLVTRGFHWINDRPFNQ